MQKQSLTTEEIRLIRKANFKHFLSSLFFFFPFIGFMISVPVFFLSVLVNLLFDVVLGTYIENLQTKVLYGWLIFSFVASLTQWLILEIALRRNKIHRITEDFIITKKEEKHHSTDDTKGSFLGRSSYYKLFLKSQKEAKVNVYPADYDLIEKGKNFTLIYYNLIDIPIKGVYQGQDIKILHLDKNKWKFGISTFKTSF